MREAVAQGINRTRPYRRYSLVQGRRRERKRSIYPGGAEKAVSGIPR